jgi:hypothetical protein
MGLVPAAGKSRLVAKSLSRRPQSVISLRWADRRRIATRGHSSAAAAPGAKRHLLLSPSHPLLAFFGVRDARRHCQQPSVICSACECLLDWRVGRCGDRGWAPPSHLQRRHHHDQHGYRVARSGACRAARRDLRASPTQHGDPRLQRQLAGYGRRACRRRTRLASSNHRAAVDWRGHHLRVLDLAIK